MDTKLWIHGDYILLEGDREKNQINKSYSALVGVKRYEGKQYRVREMGNAGVGAKAEILNRVVREASLRRWQLNKELKALRGEDMWVSGEGRLQIKETASGLGVWLMHLRKMKASVAAEWETMKVVGG